MNRKKILIVGRSLDIGGVERALLALTNKMRTDGFDVTLLLTRKEGILIDDIADGIRILDTPSFFTWMNLEKDYVFPSVFKLIIKPYLLFAYLKNIIWGLINRRMAEARQRMWKDCSQYLPEMEGYYDIALDFAGLSRRYVLDHVKASKKCTWIHSDYRVFDLDYSIDKELLEKFDSVYCVSNTCKEIFDHEQPELRFKSKVLLNTIDVNYIDSMASNGKGFDDNFMGIRLLDMTRIDPNKGLDIAVKVCAKLKKSGAKFRWYILGNDPLGYQSKLENLIKEYKVEDYFVLLGFSSNPYSFLKQADIIVHFSKFEGRSVAIDEAMALCKPIMLTNYTTAKDQIQNGVNGIICNFDEDELADTLLKLINDSTLRTRLSLQLKRETLEKVEPDFYNYVK